jgi:hypothetical protein
MRGRWRGQDKGTYGAGLSEEDILLLCRSGGSIVYGSKEMFDSMSVRQRLSCFAVYFVKKEMAGLLIERYGSRATMVCSSLSPSHQILSRRSTELFSSLGDGIGAITSSEGSHGRVQKED